MREGWIGWRLTVKATANFFLLSYPNVVVLVVLVLPTVTNTDHNMHLNWMCKKKKQVEVGEMKADQMNECKGGSSGRKWRALSTSLLKETSFDHISLLLILKVSLPTLHLDYSHLLI